MKDAARFWDCSTSIQRNVAEVLYRHQQRGIEHESSPRTDDGMWDQKNWLNIPGIFYTGDTDTCLTGRLWAPKNVLYDDLGREFIFRQPRDDQELIDVICAGMVDPFQAYGFDGHRRWTISLIRQWWKERQRLVEWIEKNANRVEWNQNEFFTQYQQMALSEFQFHLIHEAEQSLRTFAFFLDMGRCATDDDRLPDLE